MAEILSFGADKRHFLIAGLSLALLSGPAAHAQLADSLESFETHVRTSCQTLAPNRTTLQGDEADLFLRCNGALNAPTAAGGALTGKNDILEQYSGVQHLAQQSDSMVEAGRNGSINGRLSAVSAQMHQRLLAKNDAPRAVLLASNDPDDIGMAVAPRDARLDGFFSAGGSTGEQDTTTREVGFDQNTFWMAAGLDYEFSPTFVGGAAVNVSRTSADFKDVGGVSGGSTDSKSWSVALYGIVMPTEKFEINGMVGAGQIDFETSRRIQLADKNGSGFDTAGEVVRTAEGDTSGDTLQASLSASYAAVSYGAGSITPFVEANYYKADIDGFSETGAGGLNLSFEGQEIDSLQASIGVHAGHAFSKNWGVLSPYVRARAVFELADDQQIIAARYSASPNSVSSYSVATNQADDQFFDIAAGASAIFSGGVSAFAEYRTVLALEDVTHHALTAGVRFEF